MMIDGVICGNFLVFEAFGKLQNGFFFVACGKKMFIEKGNLV